MEARVFPIQFLLIYRREERMEGEEGAGDMKKF